MENKAPVIGKDIPFETIDGHLFKLIHFIPQEKSYFNPYALATVEGTAFRGTATLPVFQRTDFRNLSDAWKLRKGDEEILIYYSVKQNPNKIFKLFSAIFPTLWVRVCPKDSYKIESDSSFKPDLQGEARFLATKAIKEWKPKVFE